MLIGHLASRPPGSGHEPGRTGQPYRLLRSKLSRQSISLSLEIRPGAQGVDDRDRVREGRTTLSTLPLTYLGLYETGLEPYLEVTGTYSTTSVQLNIRNLASGA
jgi:hypothetical protein